MLHAKIEAEQLAGLRDRESSGEAGTDRATDVGGRG
jgi:hypothetical protein